MQYRKLPRSTEQIGVLGLGLGIAKSAQVEESIDYALGHDINFFDLCCYYEDSYRSFGLAACHYPRQNYFVQMHFGAVYPNGEYALSRNLNKIKQAFEKHLEDSGAGYADFGMLHCIDTQKDFRLFYKNGILDYIHSLKEQGLIRHLGLSTHTPAIARMAMDELDLDLMMFSINPAFDYNHGDYAFGEAQERQELYLKAQAQGVGISVMKPFAGGLLLNEKRSPLGVALTPSQCLRYALDKNAVVTTVPGFANLGDVKDLLKYFDKTQEELDYSCIGQSTPKALMGRCVYCNHCSPCPLGLNVGLINKYYDLSLTGDEMARDHYLQLPKHAGDCNGCGHCDRRCPFKVEQAFKMKSIKAHLGI